MSRWLGLVLLLVLAGCAGAPEQPGSVQSEARSRAKIHTDLAATYYSRAQPGVALEELAEALRADSSYSQAYNVRALVYMELREDDEAERNFRRALELDPGNSEGHNNYGWFLCQRGRVDESLAHFLAALKNPLYATPEKSYFNAGICSLKKQDDKEAERFLLNAVRVQPQHREALYRLAEIYFSRGLYREAKIYLDRLMLEPEPAAEHLWLALRNARRLGDRDGEAGYGLQLRKKYPDSREAAASRSGQF